jgi:hypothetical protein
MFVTVLNRGFAVTVILRIEIRWSFRHPIAMSAHAQQSLGSTRGSAMIQWCIAALPLLLLGSIAIEVTHWHMTRMRLSLSIQRAVDHAALSGGTTQAIKRHLEQNLPTDLRLSLRGCLTDSVDALMSDFVDRRLSEEQGQAVIRHDHVAEQHKGHVARGWRQGRGPRSGKTIFEANTLNLEVIATTQARNPWIRQMLNPLTIRLQHQAIMQSHRKNGARCLTLP